MNDAILKLATIVPMFIMAVAALVFWWAWRGRLVDRNPICRWCGFDLTGKEEDSPQCPECWGGVSRAYGVRTSGVAFGHREARSGLAALAALVFAGTFVMAFGAVLVRAAGTSMYARYPTAVLIATVTRGDEPERARAAYELSGRMRAGSLRRGELDPLLDQLLAIQADKSEPWRAAYADAMLAARRYNLIDDARWSRYIGELTRTAEQDPDAQSRAAIAELRTRALSTCMTKGELDPVLDFILERQSKAYAAWWTGLGDLVESARTVSMVDDRRWARYVRQAVGTETRVGEDLLRRGTLRVATLTSLRGGSDPIPAEAYIDTSLTVVGKSRDGQPKTILIDCAGRQRLAKLEPGRPLDQELTFDCPELADMADGRVDVTVSQAFALVFKPRSSTKVEATETRDTAVQAYLRGDYETSAEDAKQQSAEMRRAVARASFRRDPTPGVREGMVGIEVGSAPFDYACEAILTCDGRTARLGTLAAQRGQAAFLDVRVAWEGTLPDHVQVVLDSSDAAAKEQLGLARAPKVHVVLRDVPTTGTYDDDSASRARSGAPTTRLSAPAR